jgi:hypothetical protein
MMMMMMIIRVMKPRKLRWAEHVAPMGHIRIAYRTLVAKSKGRKHSEDQGVRGRMILKWI